MCWHGGKYNTDLVANLLHAPFENDMPFLTHCIDSATSPLCTHALTDKQTDRRKCDLNSKRLYYITLAENEKFAVGKNVPCNAYNSRCTFKIKRSEVTATMQSLCYILNRASCHWDSHLVSWKVANHSIFQNFSSFRCRRHFYIICQFSSSMVLFLFIPCFSTTIPYLWWNKVVYNK